MRLVAEIYNLPNTDAGKVILFTLITYQPNLVQLFNIFHYGNANNI